MPEYKNIQGGVELSRVLKQMPGNVAKKHLKAAIAQGAKDIRDEARARAPVDTGRLKKNIIVKYIAEKSDNYSVTYYVLARSGAKFAKMRIKRKGQVRYVDNDAFYWRFLEYGTAKMSARPFMRPAFQAKKDKALGSIIGKLWDGIDKEVRDLR